VTTPSDVVAARVREVRGKRHLTVADVAGRCAALGAPDLTAQALYKLEQRRPGKLRPRPVTVDELLVLAAALNVAPVHLLVPVDDPDAPYPVTPKVTTRRFTARAWVRGIGPADPDADLREFHSEVPAGEFYTPAGLDYEGTMIGAVQQGPPRRKGNEG
jgi:hypothetical protein